MDKQDVYRLVMQIPRGRVTTYGAIAKALGNPRATRRVGQILKHNPLPITVSCHRVIHADGRLGGYCGNKPSAIKKKSRFLRAEGIEFTVKQKKLCVATLPRILFTEFKWRLK